MDAFEAADRRHEDKKTKILARFAPPPPTMRIVNDPSELEALRAAGVGFIINIRDDEEPKMHRAGCRALQAMVAGKQEFIKLFCDNRRDTLKWLNTDQGKPWNSCGHCLFADEP